MGNPTVTGEFPVQMASNTEMFPFDDVIMAQTTLSHDAMAWKRFLHYMHLQEGPIMRALVFSFLFAEQIVAETVE